MNVTSKVMYALLCYARSVAYYSVSRLENPPQSSFVRPFKVNLKFKIENSQNASGRLVYLPMPSLHLFSL